MSYRRFVLCLSILGTACAVAESSPGASFDADGGAPGEDAAPIGQADGDTGEEASDAGSTGDGQQGTDGADDPPIARPFGKSPGAVFVHLFEWRWPDVARECETYLGPNGFAAVQISPPNEHALIDGAPWWQRYQPVSYRLESRSGTRAEFIDMVARCRAAGVAIYVDAVINHMTAMGSGRGSAGTQFSKYAYPDLYGAQDFHAPPCGIADDDYRNDASKVQRCELVGLSDLDTSAEYVQQTIADYLSELVGLGVDGFRIDAAKHMAPSDLDGILGRVAGEPYFFLEVIDPGYEAVRASDYAALSADITEFKGASVSEAFLNRNARLKDLRNVGDVQHGYLASEHAVSFIDNHDTQRGSALTYHDAVLHDLATVFLLAWPYGYPQLMSSYAFERESEASRSSGPPGESVFARGDVPECQDHPGRGQPGQWVCEHRARYVANLVRLRARAARAEASRWWDNGDNQIAFAREGRGFVVINRQEQTLQQTFETSLPAGTYCELYGGSMRDKVCTGRTVSVDGSGRATVEVQGMSAVILDAFERI